jgi:hypothetical protein
VVFGEWTMNGLADNGLADKACVDDEPGECAVGDADTEIGGGVDDGGDGARFPNLRRTRSLRRPSFAVGDEDALITDNA